MNTIAVGVVAALSLIAGATADAQTPSQEEGVVNVEAGHPLGSSIHYVVQVTRADGTPADDATVTATVVDAGGNEQAPATLTPFGATAADGVEIDDAGAQQGRFEGVVEFPEAGTWTVRFDASQPSGTAETTVEVLDAGATDLDAPDDGTGFAPADGAEDTSSSDGGGTSVLVIAIAAVIAVGGLAAAVRIVRRYGPSAVPANVAQDSPPAEANVGTDSDEQA